VTILARPLPYAVLLLLALPLAAQSPDAPAAMPAADELVARMIDRSQQLARQNPSQDYGFKYHEVAEELESDGRVKEHHDWDFQTVLVEGAPYDRLVLKDGKPLDEKERTREAKREAAFRKRLHEKKEGEEGGVSIDQQLVRRFLFHVMGQEEVQGHPAWLLTVLPKPDQPEARNRDEKVLSRMQGRIWIDAQNYFLVKGELDLAQPVSVGGPLGSVKTVHLDFAKEMVAPGLWLWQRWNLQYGARVLFGSIHMRRHGEYSDFQPLPR